MVGDKQPNQFMSVALMPSSSKLFLSVSWGFLNSFLYNGNNGSYKTMHLCERVKAKLLTKNSIVILKQFWGTGFPCYLKVECSYEIFPRQNSVKQKKK